MVDYGKCQNMAVRCINYCDTLINVYLSNNNLLIKFDLSSLKLSPCFGLKCLVFHLYWYGIVLQYWSLGIVLQYRSPGIVLVLSYLKKAIIVHALQIWLTTQGSLSIMEILFWLCVMLGTSVAARS